jgi:CubicO group peptidase (beta-lactamase class C family)
MTRRFLLAMAFMAMNLQALAKSPDQVDLSASASTTGPVSIDWASLAAATLKSAVTEDEIPGATVVVVNQDRILFEGGFGVASLDTGAAVTNETLFEVGSVGKVLTAIAVLQQVEQGRLDLAEDVNSYLDNWETAAPGNAAITLHHLLTHSAGLNDRAIGYAVRDETDLQTLGVHLAEHLPASFAAPGRYISYSNYGFGLAGYLVEKESGTTFKDYVTRNILEPLGITRSGYRPNIDGPVATGYVSRNDGLGAAPIFHRPVTPAGSFIASSQDMALLLQTLLKDGAPILDHTSVAMMTQNRQTQHARLMGNAYGLEETRRGNLTAFGKGGSIPGFTAYMAVVPEHDLGLFVAVNASSDEAIDRFVVEAFDRLASGMPALSPPVPTNISRFTGEYRSNRYDRGSVEKLLRLEIRHVYPGTDSQLAVWHDGDMNKYQAIDTLVFQNVGETNRFLVFEEDENGNVSHAFFNDRIAGGYVPVVWEKNGFWNSNEYVNEYFGLVLLAALSYLLFPLVVIVRAIRRRAADKSNYNAGRWVNVAGVTTSALVFAYVWFYFIPLMRARPDLIFGIPQKLAPLEILSWLIVTGFGAFAGLWLSDIVRGKRSLPRQLFGFVFLLSGIFVCEFLFRWNLL